MSHAYSNVETFVPRLSPASLSSMRKDMVDLTPFFPPEGQLLHTPENRAACASSGGLLQAMAAGTVLEGTALLCDQEHNLTVSLGNGILGTIPREEAALGIAEGTTRDIALLSRVSKPVVFLVTGFETLPDGRTRARLSRRAAQALCRSRHLDLLRPGDILPAKVTRLESFGAFCDIGCGVSALLPIAGISVSRISHPADRLAVGMDILAVLASWEGDRFCLSQRELLGTWEENVAGFAPGDTVAGIVRSVEEYGVFVELTPNLAGLAEPREGVRPGQLAGVYIKSILPEKMKMKLILIDAQESAPPPELPRYFLTGGHIDRWIYSPAACPRRIETVFDETTGTEM